MLSTSEREIAENAVALFIGYAERPRSTLLAMVVDQEFALSMPIDSPNARRLAEAAIDLCIASRWKYIPPWLVQVLRRVTQTPEVAAILARIANPPPDWSAPVPSNPFNAQWLPRPGLPFLNRVSFRESLRRLNAPVGPSVLIVNGSSKSGKSYSVEIIYHALRESAPAERRELPVPVALVTLRRDMGASLSPDVLARMIAERISPKPKPMESVEGENETVTTNRLNERLCDWIVRTAEDTGEQWWVVLDNLDDRGLTPVTRNFISKLVEVLTLGKHHKKLRLVITDYPTELIEGVPISQMETERLSPIGEVDLKAFFEEQFQRLGGPPPASQAVRVAVILALLNLPQDQSRLQILNDRLRAFIENLSGEGSNA